MNINDLIETKIFELKSDDLIYKSSGMNLEGKKFYDYNKLLEKKEFGLFSNLWIKLFKDQFPINQNVPVNVFFCEEYSIWKLNRIIELTNYLHSKIGMSDDFKTSWDSLDNKNIRTGIFSRYWHIDNEGATVYEADNESYMVGLSISPDLDSKSNKDCITLGIWNYQNSL